MVSAIDFSTVKNNNFDLNNLDPANPLLVAKLISAAEQAKTQENENFKAIRAQLSQKLKNRKAPVIGITGTGGAGKSSLTDELILRMLHDLKDIHIAIISCDPSRRKTGGALLGDRIRMNAISNARVYFRSLATRRSRTELPAALPEAIEVTQAAGYDLIITETAGIGGFAMATAPALVTFIGGAPKDAINTTLDMYEITYTEHKYFTIPFLDFRGTPTGIDIRKVVESGITPRVNTGIAHKDAGVGQIGAGLVRPPMAMFEEALVAFAERYGY
jgi:molybdopterin-guanine dinucleotide biosynthesis protein